MKVLKMVDVASARHHARVLARQVVVLQIRSVRTQKSKYYQKEAASKGAASFLWDYSLAADKYFSRHRSRSNFGLPLADASLITS